MYVINYNAAGLDYWDCHKELGASLNMNATTIKKPRSIDTTTSTTVQ